jgi:transglutaminase-like putative cysteine protease
MIYLASSEFEMAGYKGNMNTWENLGKFMQDLRGGRDQLPADIKQKVHELTDKEPDPNKKVAKLYEFMQQNTRYVSIQLGIGGLQPFDATYVATKRYGDCKALSNYMSALLKEIGVPSYYTLVKSGEGNTFFVPDFPSDQFDHVILCVPLKKDTMWLECTDQTLPAGIFKWIYFRQVCFNR